MLKGRNSWTSRTREYNWSQRANRGQSFEDPFPAQVTSLPRVNHAAGQRGQRHSWLDMDGRMPRAAVARKEEASAMSYRATAFAEALPELGDPGCTPERLAHLEERGCGSA